MTGSGESLMTQPRQRQKALWATAWRAGMLTLAGSALGISVNWLHPKGVPFAWYEPPTMCSASQLEANRITVLPPNQASQLCGHTETLVADVRSAESFTRGHIAGAVHIPCTGSGADVTRVKRLLFGKQTLVVYGTSEEEALRVASDLARKLELPKLTVFVIGGGWTAWSDAGLACSSGPCDGCDGETSHAESR